MFRRAPAGAMPERVAESRSLWVLRGLPQSTARDVELWLDAIAELPFDAWIHIAERYASADQAPLAMTRACKRVERIITDQGLEFTAWLVRDLVETATHHVRHSATRQPRRLRARLSVARIAAEWAALAKVCQPWLSYEDYELLCAPFAEPSRRRSEVV